MATDDNKAHMRQLINLRMTARGTAIQENRMRVRMPSIIAGVKLPKPAKLSIQEIDRRVLAWLAAAQERGDRISWAAALRAVWDHHTKSASRAEVLARVIEMVPMGKAGAPRKAR